MAKIPRVTNKIFGETATAVGNDPEIGQFGSALARTYNGTTDIATIQALSAWSNGFIGAVLPDKQYPALPEMTGFGKVLSQQLSYLFQSGIAEWDSNTTYYTTSFCQKNGKIWKSLQDENINNAPDSSPTYWGEFTSGGGMPIGTVFPVVCTSNYVPDGALPCDGAEYSKAQFLDFWVNYLTASSPLINTCTYSQYTSDINTYGSCAKFGIDTINNKFKTPTIKDGQYITQAKTTSELGKSYKESLPNISGYLNEISLNEDYSGSASGAFFLANKGTWNDGSGFQGDGESHNYDLYFEASNTSGVWQNGAKVQGNNVRLRYFVQVANGQINQSQMDWSAWASSLADKASIDFASTAAFPSTTSINLTIGASGASYTAPADGWISIAGGGSSADCFIWLWISRTKIRVVSTGCNSNWGAGAVVPVKQGDVVTINYGNIAQWHTKVFIYAEGEA